MIPEGVDEPQVRFVRDVEGSAANAGASTQTFQQQPGYGGFGGFPGAGGFGSSGSAANAGKENYSILKY